MLAKPNSLIITHQNLLTGGDLKGPILDLACGDGRNGLFFAEKGIPVILADRSEESLAKAKRIADEKRLSITFWQVDLEAGSGNPLQEDFYGAILVFRYLHRPLIPFIRKGLRPGGVLIYETFTMEQPRFGKPRNPDFLLKSGELRAWFQDWIVIHHYEGILINPERAIAQLVCMKPE